MIRDRGNLKWTSMMLPEHIKKLRVWVDDDKKTDKPQLDDLELELISDEITRAFNSKCEVKLTIWREGYLLHDFGKIIEINNKNKMIVLDDPFSTTHYPFDEIVSVSLID